MAAGADSMTRYYDDAFNHAWINMRPGYVVEAFEAVPFYYEVLQKNRKRHEGGEFFTVSVKYGANTSTKWLDSDRDTVSLDTEEKSTAAYYQLKTLAVNITRYKSKERAAYGNADSRARYTEDTIGDAKASMIDELNDMAASDGSADANAPKGIPHFIPEDPTTGTVANINRATSGNEFWQSRTTNLVDKSPVGNLYDEMEIMYKKCGRKAVGIKGAGRFPDMAFGGETAHTYYTREVDDRTQHTQPASTGGGVGALGFDRVHFKNIWVWWDAAFSDSKIYFLNSNYIEFRVHPLDEFTMTEWKTEADKPLARYAQITITCAIVFLSCNRHGVIYNIAQSS